MKIERLARACCWPTNSDNSCGRSAVSAASSARRSAVTMRGDVVMTPSPRRPREGGDPYAVCPRFGSVAEASSSHRVQGLWVPAFAGTTGERYHSPRQLLQPEPDQLRRLSILAGAARGCGDGGRRLRLAV